MTQTDLYRSITGDRDTHHRTIGAALEQAEPTQRRVIALYANGLTDREVGKRTNRAHGSARGILRRAMLAAYNRIHGLPRYYKVGRPHRRQAAAVARIAAPEEPGTPSSFRDFLTPDERARL
jgi:hypothetical protein